MTGAKHTPGVPWVNTPRCLAPPPRSPSVRSVPQDSSKTPRQEGAHAQEPVSNLYHDRAMTTQELSINNVLSQYPIGCVVDQCAVHTKCPPGKYTKVVGSSSAQTKCEPCAAGFYKATTSNSSMKTDNCTLHHSQCPPGKHTTVTGSASPQRTCETCSAGFFKPITFKNSTCSRGRCLAIMICEKPPA